MVKARVGTASVHDVPPWANLTRSQQVLSAVLFSVAYVLTAALAKRFDLPNGAAAWYPPAAVMFAYLLVAGPRFVPVAIVVRLASDLVNYPEIVDRDGATAIVVGAAVVAGIYAWGAWVLRRNRLDHAQLRQFGWFAVIGVMACPVLAATGFALVDVVVNATPAAAARDQIATFWVGDAVAIASIVPFLLLAAYARHHRSRPVRLPSRFGERVEVLAQAVAIVVVPAGIFVLSGAEDVVPFLFLAMLPVIWVALRQDLLVASLGILVTNTLVAVGAQIRLGATDELVAVQTLMLASALAALYSGAIRRTEAERLAATLESESRYRTLVEHSPAFVARFDATGRLLLHAGRLDGSPTSPDAIVAGLTERWSEVAPTDLADKPTDLEWSLGDGEDRRWLETRAVAETTLDGASPSLLTVTSDRTSIRRVADELAAVARRDPLTGLPNRIAIEEALDVARRDPRRRAEQSVIAVVLDEAETLTAGLRRAVVDLIAVAVAERLRAIAGDGDLIARTGTTSFAILSAQVSDAGRLADAAVDAIARPVDLPGDIVHLRASAGISEATEDAPGPRLEHAELAARFAQEAGGSRAAHFAPSMVAAAADTRAIIHGLRRGIERDELVVHYQPVVALDDGHTIGAEALVRWQRPGHGLVGPVEFIEIAEQSGLIDDIGAAVERITRDELVPGWSRRADDGFVLNLNVSARQLRMPAFVPRVTDAIAAFTAAGITLHLELTETAIMADPAEAIAVLGRLRDQGASIVLDDFGTGFSAISWLHQLPVDAIKLDRSFVTGLPDDPASMRIARLITALANELGLELTAEGVETEGQRQALLGLGCTQAQGFLFAHPLPLPDLLAHLPPPHAIGDR